MPIGYYRRPALAFAALTLVIATLFLNLATTHTSARGQVQNVAPSEANSQAQLRELDQNLNNSNLLLLRTGAFDPLESEPATVNIGQAHLETPSQPARSARLAASAAQLPAENRQACFIVQYAGRILPGWTQSLRARGFEIVGYLPNNAYIVRT